MSSIKDRFKRTKLKTLNDQDKELQQRGFKGKSRRNYLKIEDGENYFRLLPAHIESKSFAYKAVRHQLPWIYAQENGPDRESFKNIFNARQHGGAKKDIIEEYIKFVEYIASSEMGDKSEKEIEDFLKHVNGWKGERWNRGLGADDKDMMYAISCSRSSKGELIAGDIGVLEIGKSIKTDINKMAAGAQDEEDPAGTEPFTDPEIGIPIKITRNSKAKKPADYYITEFYKLKSAASPVPIPTPWAIDDEILEELDKKDSLEKMYGPNVYTRRDFELALKGLELFDKKFKYGVFEYDEWNDIVTELSEDWPVEGESEDEGETEDKKSEASPKTSTKSSTKGRVSRIPKADTTKAKVTTTTKKEVKKEEAPDGPEYADPRLGQLLEAQDRGGLKAVIMELELDVVVKRGVSDGRVREMIVQAIVPLMDDEEFVEQLEEIYKEEGIPPQEVEDENDNFLEEMNQAMDEVENMDFEEEDED
jgi:hypothetical protein